MKRIFKLTAMCLFTVLLVTGCAMKTEYEIKVENNKNVKVEVVAASDDEMIDQMISTKKGDANGTTYTDKERWELIESGETTKSAGNFTDYKLKKYDKDGYKGYLYSINLGKIDNLINDTDDVLTLDKIGKDSKIFSKDGDVYTLKVRISDAQESQKTQYESMIDFDFILKVTLPTKAKSNNATEVKGNTYIWDLTKAETIELSFDFNGVKTGLNPVMIAGGVCALAGIGICVFVLVNKKKKTK